MGQSSKSAVILWVSVGLAFLLLSIYSAKRLPSATEISYSKMWQEVTNKNVKSVVIEGNELRGEYVNNAVHFTATIPENDPDLLANLRQNVTDVKVKLPPEDPWYLMLLFNMLPILLLVGLWFLFMRQMQLGAGKGMSFGKSRARLLSENQNKITFEDVAGIDEARDELQEIIDFLKDPKKFTKLGGRIPKGVLLVGSPGTGKTLLARAIAGEAGVPFFSISGSDFVEMFVGVGASRVRDLFVQGKKNAPCLIFIDEIDAVGRHRGSGMGGGHDEREQTLNQLLVEMDGFESNEGVILIAATNRPDVLDPALLRPGRFDRRVVVPRPDINGRLGILKVHTKKVPVAKDVDLNVVARGTPGFSGADLEILVNESALNAAKYERTEVTHADFEFAKDKVMMGSERRSLLLSEDDKRRTAYHEAGHALVALMLPNTDPVHKLTIVPRGMALGLMWQIPEADKHTYTKKFFLAKIAVAFGGWAAEELIFDEYTTGASSDIQSATDIARRMVCEWGMTEALGTINYGSEKGELFLGREFGTNKHHSEETSAKIDSEVRKIIETQLQVARDIIRVNREKLEKLSQELLVRETLDAKEIAEILEIQSPETQAAS